MRLHNLDNTSIKYYLTEDLKKDPALNEHWDRIDNEFFKPWQQYLNEATLTPDQINQMFAAAEKETSAGGGGNSTMLGKIVDKIIPDSFLGKLEKALPEPDPKAVADPEFEAKATAAVNNLEAPAETKTGLMAIVKAALKNPQAQAVVLSLVGGVLGGLMSKAGPLIATFFPGGGTAAVAITGALVAGGVAIAAAKLQGKPWKEAFKGAIKPALAGAAGAVIGQFAAGIAGAAVDKVAGALSSNKPADTGAPPGGAQGSPELQQAMADDQAFQDRMLNKFPPDKGYTFSAKGDSLQVFDANGRQVFNGDIPLKTMGMKTFADLTNNGQMATSGTTSGSIAGDPMAGVTDAGGGSRRGNASSEVPAGAPTSPKADRTARAEDARQNAISDGASPQEANEIAAKMMKYGTVISAGQGRGDVYQKPGLESVERTGKKLSEGQVYLVFNNIVTRNNYLLTEGRLVEGPMDWLKTKARNLTTKVTADKLNSAWQKAGSPTDSEQLKKFLIDQGVATEVVDKVYTTLKLPAAGTDPAAAAADPAAAGADPAAAAALDPKQAETLYAKVKKEIVTLDKKSQKQMAAYLQKQLGTA